MKFGLSASASSSSTSASGSVEISQQAEQRYLDFAPACQWLLSTRYMELRDHSSPAPPTHSKQTKLWPPKPYLTSRISCSCLSSPHNCAACAKDVLQGTKSGAHVIAAFEVQLNHALISSLAVSNDIRSEQTRFGGGFKLPRQSCSSISGHPSAHTGE